MTIVSSCPVRIAGRLVKFTLVRVMTVSKEFESVICSLVLNVGCTFPFSNSQLKSIQQTPLTVMLGMAVSRHEHSVSAQEGAGTQMLVVQQDVSQGRGETEHPRTVFNTIFPNYRKLHRRMSLMELPVILISFYV